MLKERTICTHRAFRDNGQSDRLLAGGVMPTWAMVKKPELAVASMYDPRIDSRTDSERFRDSAKEAGIDESDPTWLRIISALEAMEKWQAGMMVDYLEIAFIGFELQAATKAFNEAHRSKETKPGA
jgi:hypothetical protein